MDVTSKRFVMRLAEELPRTGELLMSTTHLAFHCHVILHVSLGVNLGVLIKIEKTYEQV